LLLVLPYPTPSSLYYMSIRIYPAPNLFDAATARFRLASKVDQELLVDKGQFNVPYSYFPAPFILETSAPNTLHTITVNNNKVLTITPLAESTTLNIPLEQCNNDIKVTNTTGLVGYGDVSATIIQTWFATLGREFFVAGGQQVQELQVQLNSPWTSRLSAHLLRYSELFLPSRMPKIHQTKIALTQVMGRLGFGDGVLNIATAMTYSTPYASKVRASEFTIPGTLMYPVLTTFPTTGESIVLDVWMPNACLAAKLALVQLCQSIGAPDAAQPAPLLLENFDDYQVLLKSSGGPIEVQTINPLSADCNNIEDVLTCDRTRLFTTLRSTVDIVMNTPQLSFDSVVTQKILFGFFDDGIPFDSGLLLDTRDPDDPFGSGFVGVSLDGRLDGGSCLDSRVQRGQRIIKHVLPIADVNSLTPIEPVSSALVVDAGTDAPPPDTGETVIWAVSAKPYITDGSFVRFRDPAYELQVDTVWPVYDEDRIFAITDNATVSVSVGVFTITSDVGFFSFRCTGAGIIINDDEKCSVISVSEDGSSCVVTGNPNIPLGAVTVLGVYDPVRDRAQEFHVGLAGNRLYELTFVTALTADLTEGYVADLRPAPTTMATALIGDDTLSIATDLVLMPNDVLYITTSMTHVVDSAINTGLFDEGSGLPIWTVTLLTTLTVNLAARTFLYCFRSEPCWEGTPITLLNVTTFRPTGYISP
jgi:hypothetical protein